MRSKALHTDMTLSSTWGFVMSDMGRKVGRDCGGNGV